MATKTTSIVEMKEIRVSFILDPRDPDEKTLFSVTGNLKEKSKSYPAMCSALASVLEDLADPNTIEVEDFIPTNLSIKEFRHKCRIKFRRIGVVKDDDNDPNVSVVANLEEFQVFIPLTEFGR